MAEAAVDTIIAIEAEGWLRLEPALADTVRIAAEAAARAGGLLGDRAELSVLLTEDVRMTGLNEEWRGKTGATNVLSFSGDLDGPGPALLGDVVLSFETVEREAAAGGINFSDHVAHLVVHGVLHLLGYDHETDADAERMESLETEILASLRIGNPFAVEMKEVFGAVR